MTPLVFFVFSLLYSFSPAQNDSLRVPRDPEKLVARAQEYWSYVIAGQRLKAVQFVVPQKRDAFVSIATLPASGAKVAGIELTNDGTRATLRVQLTMLLSEAGVDRPAWVIQDHWVWRNNNWFVDVGSPRDLLESRISDNAD